MLEDNPGWPLRNLLVWASARLGQETVKVVCFRESLRESDRDGGSRVLTLNLPKPTVKVVGWEKDGKGRMASRVADLSQNMDPAKYT